jgi:hypothetical protein
MGLVKPSDSIKLTALNGKHSAGDGRKFSA